MDRDAKLDAPVQESVIKNGQWTVPKFAAGHLQGTAYPGGPGNAVFCGHISSISSGDVFANIGKLSSGDDIVLITEVPGVRKSDLNIQVKGNTIRIAGTKNVEYGEGAALHRRERLAGRFDRAVTVPVEIDADRVKAECRDGILALYLPRAELDKPKSIAVS